MHNILVTGANGQLGKKIHDESSEFSDFKFIYTDFEELDISNPKQIEQFFSDHTIDLVINCGAYTNVDGAEQNREAAGLLNAEAPKFLADACQKHEAYFIHISTDYVFGSSNQNTPFKETDVISPNSIYGKTKAKGEEYLKSYNNTLVIRTAWLYSEYGNNFMKTMLRLGTERDTLAVVFDQISTPTYAGDLANAVLLIAKILLKKKRETTFEILHFSNEGVCSWYDFTYEIFKHEKINCSLHPIRSSEYPTPAPRPPYSVLDKSLIKEKYNIQIPYFKESLYLCLRNLNKKTTNALHH
ncbi:MAG: dTDP-4-dehydrorhamnose reductase [Bacteroidota bacterium]|nr:dTDP-4-dehydrorhamnose reductase [Bacteroidota bacterium]